MHRNHNFYGFCAFCGQNASRRFLAFSLAVTLSLFGFLTTAPAEVAVPRLTARVTDQTGTLTADQIAQLEQRLRQFEAGKGSQVALLIVPTTQPETIEQYGIRVAEAWKVGRKGVDDGALLLVAKEDRAVRIEVGYGLEGALPDAIAKRIIEEVIVPRFRQGDFFAGVSEGLERIIGVIEGEPLPPPTRSGSVGQGDSGEWLPFLLFGGIALGGIFRALFGRMLGATLGGGLAGFLVWTVLGFAVLGVFFGLMIFLMILFGNSSRGGSGMRGGGFSSGGFSGGGGGGFRGGGGGFGGGGASGRW